MALLSKIIIVLTLLFTVACATTPEPRSYLEYSGFITGCMDNNIDLMQQSYPEINEDNIPYQFVARCMELYIERLEKENIKPKMKRHKKSDVI